MLDKDPMAVSIKTAGYMLSISRATVYRLLDTNQLESVKIGTRNLILMASIKKLLRAGKEAA